jgi:hypothetical protein
MPEPVAVDLIEADLGDAFGSKRDPVEVHVGHPARGRTLEPPERTPTDLEAVTPRMLLEWDREWTQLCDQGDALARAAAA